MKQNHSNDCIIPMVFHLLVILLAAVLYWQHRNYEKSNAAQTTPKDLGEILKDIANDQWLNAETGVRILSSILRILSTQNNNKKQTGGRVWKRA